MKIYLASLEQKVSFLQEINLDIYVLSSFFTMREKFIEFIPCFKDFILDSGAFSFMNCSIRNIGWNEYLKKYAKFINENHIKNFFELDIDSIVGYSKVKEYRKELENLTGERCIPVWHRSRGIDEFFSLCDEYDYIALGGIAIGHIKPSEHKYFSYFIQEAHKRNTKIHGLGYTSISNLKKYHFDSVDSTTWTTGGRFGFIFRFTGNSLIREKISGSNTGMRLSDCSILDKLNLKEWLKFQKYAEVHL